MPFSLDYMQKTQRDFLKKLFGIKNQETKKLDPKLSKIRIQKKKFCTSQKSETKVSLIDQFVSQEDSQFVPNLNNSNSKKKVNLNQEKTENKVFSGKLVSFVELRDEDFAKDFFIEKSMVGLVSNNNQRKRGIGKV